jgi:hypothetical protein
MNCFLKILMIILKSSSILLLISVVSLVIAIIITIIKGICNKSWCQINTNVSVSLDDGKTYASNYSHISYKQTIHLKYEISARVNSILPRSIFYKIPFHIEIPEHGMDITLHEYSGICEPKPEGGLILTSKNKFAVYANRIKTEKVKIVLKCKRNSEKDTLFVFRLLFQDKQLERYSKTIALEVYES